MSLGGRCDALIVESAVAKSVGALWRREFVSRRIHEISKKSANLVWRRGRDSVPVTTCNARRAKPEGDPNVND